MDEFELSDESAPMLPKSRDIPRWPLLVVFGVSAAAIGAAVVLRAYVPALVAYAAVLVVGCSLLFYRRRLAIAETRRAGGMGYVAIHGLERAGLWVLALACLANGLVIAEEWASWDWSWLGLEWLV